jgi:hypothetical protein
MDRLAYGESRSGRFAIDSSSLHFKATVAAIVSAFHSQSQVFVAYSDGPSCLAWSNAADIHYVCVGTSC